MKLTKPMSEKSQKRFFYEIFVVSFSFFILFIALNDYIKDFYEKFQTLTNYLEIKKYELLSEEEIIDYVFTFKENVPSGEYRYVSAPGNLDDKNIFNKSFNDSVYIDDVIYCQGYAVSMNSTYLIAMNPERKIDNIPSQYPFIVNIPSSYANKDNINVIRKIISENEEQYAYVFPFKNNNKAIVAIYKSSLKCIYYFLDYSTNTITELDDNNLYLKYINKDTNVALFTRNNTSKNPFSLNKHSIVVFDEYGKKIDEY